MAKFSKRTALGEPDAAELVQEFFELVGKLRGPRELAKVMRDLVSRQELVMIARRLKIAELLLSGSTYAEVRTKTKASMPTIARISGWLASSGEGVKLLMEKKKSSSAK